MSPPKPQPTPKSLGIRPTPIHRMSRRRLMRIARYARKAHSFIYDSFTGWASDKREFLLALWGPKIVDGPHGRCPVCLERRSAPNVCSWDECPSHKKKEAEGGPDAE